MTETLTLGERKWEIRRLTLRQLREVLPLIGKLSGATPEAAIDVAAEIVRIAVSRAYPEVTIDQIMDAEASVLDLLAATAQIVQVSGLRQGEAEAVARLNGLMSTGSSAGEVIGTA